MKKLSSTFVEFISPLLKEFGSPQPMTTEFDAVCAIGHAVWNAVSLESLHPEKSYLAEVRARSTDTPAILDIIDKLEARKREIFSSDNRVMGSFEIRKKLNGEFSLWTQIHDEAVIQ